MLNEFLQFLAFGGGSVTLVSWLAEMFGWFQGLDTKKKKLYSFLTSAVIGIGSYSVVTYVSAEIVAALTPFFMILSSIFGTYFIGEVFHSETKKETPQKVNVV